MNDATFPLTVEQARLVEEWACRIDASNVQLGALEEETSPWDPEDEALYQSLCDWLIAQLHAPVSPVQRGEQ